jgi:hypothetical protein
MIENQDQANQRANEIAQKYGLTEAFRYETAAEIALALWQAAYAKITAEDYPAAQEIVELVYYLDSNYYYGYWLAKLYFYSGQYETSLDLVNYVLNQGIATDTGDFTDLPDAERIPSLANFLALENFIALGDQQSAASVIDALLPTDLDQVKPDTLVNDAWVIYDYGNTELASHLIDTAEAILSLYQDDLDRAAAQNIIEEIKAIIAKSEATTQAFLAQQNQATPQSPA